MLSKTLKLSLRQNNIFFSKSQKCFSPLFSIYFQTNQEEKKILVIIPKKNIKKASARNKAKRRIYNFLVNKLDKLNQIHLVIILKKDIKNISDLELEELLDKQLKKNIL